MKLQTLSTDLKVSATAKSLKSHLNICQKACCVLEERLNQIFQVVSTRWIRTKYLKFKTPTTKVMANQFIDHTMKGKDFVQPIVDDGIIRFISIISFIQNKKFYQEKKKQGSKLVDETKSTRKQEYTRRENTEIGKARFS